MRAPRCTSRASRCRTIPLVVVTEDVEKPGNVGAVLRSADGAGADAVIAAARHGPVQPERDPGERRHGLRVPARRGPTAEALAWLAARACGSSRRAWTPPPYTRRRPARPARARRSAARPTACRDAWPARDVEPIRLPMHGVADSLNVSVAAAILLYEAWRQRTRTRRASPSAALAGHEHDSSTSSIIGAGPAGEAAAFKARELGATVAIVDRRWFGGSCPHIGCLPSKSLLHGAARHHANPRAPVAAGFGRTATTWSTARRTPTSPTTAKHVQRPREGGRDRLPRRRPRSRPGHRRGPPRRRGPRARGDARRRRGRLDTRSRRRIPGLDDVRSGRTARRPWPASCHAACSSSAAGRRAASSPRSTRGSACRRRSSSPGRDSPRPTIRATPRSIRDALEEDGVDVRTGVRAVAARAGAGADGAHVDRPRRRLARRGSRAPPRGRAGSSRSTISGWSTTASTRRAGRRPSRATGGCARRRPVGRSATPPAPSCTRTRPTTRASWRSGWRSATTSAPDYRALPRATYTDPEAAFVGVTVEQARTPASTRSSSSPTSRRAPAATRSRPSSAT